MSASREVPVVILCISEDDEEIDVKSNFDVFSSGSKSPINLDSFAVTCSTTPKSVLVQSGINRNKSRKSVQLECNDDNVSFRDDLKTLYSDTRKKSSRHNSIVPQVRLIYFILNRYF